MDAAINNIEAYSCSVVGGEPVLTKLNPLKLRIYRSGYSNHIEDADVVVYEDYWSPGRIIDTYYDELSAKDIKWLANELPDFGGSGPVGAAGNYNEAYPFISKSRFIGETESSLTGTPDLLKCLTNLRIWMAGLARIFFRMI